MGKGLWKRGLQARGHARLEERGMIRVFSTKGATHTSLGQGPRFLPPTGMSPEGAGHRPTEGGLGRPFRAWVIFTTGYLGPCPRLV